MKRHLKVYICVVVTILRLFLFGLHSLLYATGGLVGAPQHQIEIMTDLLLCSRCR